MVGCHFLLQTVFPTQGWNPGLQHCRQTIYSLSHQGSPKWRSVEINKWSDMLMLFSCSVMSNSFQPLELQHTRLPCPSPSPRVCSNSSLLSRWCHPTILSSVIPFSSCLQSFPASGSFPMSQFFISSGQSIGASASTSVLPMNTRVAFL